MTQVDDQSHPRKTAMKVTELTTYCRDRNSSSDDTRSPPANMVSGSYKFHIGSSQNVFRRTRGNATGQRSSYVSAYFAVA